MQKNMKPNNFFILLTLVLLPLAASSTEMTKEDVVLFLPQEQLAVPYGKQNSLSPELESLRREQHQDHINKIVAVKNSNFRIQYEWAKWFLEIQIKSLESSIKYDVDGVVKEQYDRYKNYHKILTHRQCIECERKILSE